MYWKCGVVNKITQIIESFFFHRIIPRNTQMHTFHQVCRPEKLPWGQHTPCSNPKRLPVSVVHLRFSEAVFWEFLCLPGSLKTRAS